MALTTHLAPKVFYVEDALMQPFVYVIFSLASVLGLSLSSFVLDYGLFKLAQSAPGSNALAVFNIMLFRLKPNFLMLQHFSALTLFLATAISVDIKTYDQLVQALLDAWEYQLFPQSQVVLAGITLVCSTLSTLLFHSLLSRALHTVKVKGSEHRASKYRATVYTLVCDFLNLAMFFCCFVQTLYLSSGIAILLSI